MRGDVPRHGGSGQREDDERGDHGGGGLRRMKASKSSIGQTMKSAQTSILLKMLCPVTPTTPPTKEEAAMVSKNRASPSFCSLLNFDAISSSCSVYRENNSLYADLVYLYLSAS